MIFKNRESKNWIKTHRFTLLFPLRFHVEIIELDSPYWPPLHVNSRNKRFRWNFFGVASRARLALHLNGRDACKCTAIALRRDSKTWLPSVNPMRIAAWRLQESNLTYSQRVAKRPSHSLINVVSQSFLARPRLFSPSFPVELHRIGIYRPTEKKNPCPSPMEFFLLSLLHFNYTGAKWRSKSRGIEVAERIG